MSCAPTDRGPRRLLALAVAVAATVGAIGLLGAVTGHDDAAQPGDVRMTIRDFAFVPATLQVEGRDLDLFMENADATLHDFTIAGVVSVDVPGGRSRRTTVTLAPGRYPFLCTCTRRWSEP
jgi:plastocyanin